MTYFLDFDRTLFDTDAFNRTLADEPACAPFRDEILRILSTPYSVLGSTDPVRKAVWNKVSEVIRSGTLSFAPGHLAPFVYKDVPEFLRSVGNEGIIVTYGEPDRQRTKIESGLAGIVRLTVLYTGDMTKAEYLKEHAHLVPASGIFVDDRPLELEGVGNAFPQLRLFEMRRDGGEGDGRWPVIRSLSELP